MDLREKEPYEWGPFRITPLELPHPDGVSGYRIEAGGKSMVYATDVEHGEDLVRELVDFCEGVDLLIHDAQFTRAEYRGEGCMARVGWGHSSWEDAVEVARRAEVRNLRLFHHDPRRDDRDVAKIEAEACGRFEHCRAACEGELVAL